ncbi:gamma-glutamyltransferase family protein [Rhizobium sp. R86522]|uniref:gamma-glutamyltransferase family protein n=1 Tax=Rhizobium sp. R86522 TaxID=3093861 RepID=UPI0036718589
MVVSPHPLATEAGRAVLARGGNAIEAAVAVAAVLAVVMPHFCGLGGDAVWLVCDREGRRRCFLGIGQAAAGVTVPKDAIPTRGPSSMLTSACAVDSWGHALTFSAANWAGRECFTDLMSPAIGLADGGYIPSASQDFWLDFRGQEHPVWPGFAAIFDHRSDAGLLRQPQLAASLRSLAIEGYRSFYEGSLSEAIADGLAKVGSPLNTADLAATRTREVDPLALDYRGTLLLAPPPPTQGCSTLAIMGVLSRFDLVETTPRTAARMHLLVEATKQAFLKRSSIADPDFDTGKHDPAAAMLEACTLDAAARRIDPASAMAWPHPINSADTVFFAVTDPQGRCASLLQSTYFDWGSGVTVPGTGILWQNRGAAFSTEPGHPNCLAPGKRPFYTLNPGIAIRDGEPYLLYGTQGADGQPQTLSVLLTSLLDDDMTPEQALAQPRFLLGRTFSDSRDSLKIEGSLLPEEAEALSALGHEVAKLPALSPIFGQAGVIRLSENGSVEGAHDPRGNGSAASVALPPDQNR